MVRKVLLVGLMAFSVAVFTQCSSGGTTGGTGGGSSGTGGSHTGGSSGTGGTSGTGGSSGTGGTSGTGGSHTGGGTAGTGGSGGNGGSSGTGGSGASCTIGSADTCATGSECFITDTQNPTAGTCFSGACNVVTQDCGAGMKCAYVASGSSAARGCVPDGDAGFGAMCGASGDNCVAGAFCSSNSMTCLQFCQPGVTNCGTGSACDQVIQFPGIAELPAVCATVSATCNLLSQNCTNTAQNCLPTTGGGTACFASGSTANGATCTTSGACMKGSVCVGQCAPLCNLAGGAPTCTGGTTCQDVMINVQDAGACG